MFWVKMHKEKLVLGGVALKVLLPSVTTDLYEAEFSGLTVMETKF